MKSIESHPIDFYIDYGLRVTLNTDNRLVSDTTMTDEFMLAIELLHLSYEDVKNLIINGFKSAFIPYKERVNLLNAALQEMNELEEEVLQEKVIIEETI